MRRAFAIAALVCACSESGNPAPDTGTAPEDAAPLDAADAGSNDAIVNEFVLVGTSSLAGRGMNAALALVGDHAYVGSRTDGVTHANAGVLIVDVRDPAQPALVGTIGPPDQGLIGMTSRELRALPDQDLLIVLNIACGNQAGCGRDRTGFPATGGTAENDNFKFYDVSDPVRPVLAATYDFGVSDATPRMPRPHEFFVWSDPMNAARTLIYVSTPGGVPDLQVLDISDLANIRVVASWDAHRDGMLDEPVAPLTFLHSVAVSDDGRTAYVSYYGGGFFLVDTSDLAMDLPSPQIRVLTPQENRVDVSPPLAPGTHSAALVPGRNLAFVTDEIYPFPINAGCPYGWARLIDVSDPMRPTTASELKLRENQPEFCDTSPPMNAIWSAHSATALEDIVFVSWHSGGLVAASIADSSAPEMLAIYSPDPIASVTVEDPTLGGAPILVWSDPIIRDGIIYVVDVRNGLYLLRYRGAHQEQVEAVGFREGNSNL